MTRLLSKFSDFCKRAKPVLNDFFCGKLYPLAIAVLVLIGYISGIEFWLNIFVVLSACLALFVCRSIKPFIPVIFLIVYQVNLKHSPSYSPQYPDGSDYYFKGFKPIIILLLAALLAASLIYYAAKHVFPCLSFKRSPLLTPIIILSAAFILNGAFSKAWSLASLFYGLAEVLIFFFLFYLLYHGLEEDRTSDIIEYFSYISLLVAMVLVGEVAFVYLTYENLISDGAIVREFLFFGWGVQNSMGFALSVTIPPLMRGAMKSKHYIVYLIAAGLSWISALLTLSRNAWLCSTLAIAISLIIACFCSDKKKFYRIFTVSSCVIGIIGVFILRDKASALFSKIIEVGFSSNGRVLLWKYGIANFFECPIFGKGFFGYGNTDGTGAYFVISFLPDMAHNTFVQLLSGMGIFGFAAYVYYRAKTVTPLIKRPTFEKTMLYLTVAVTLGASMFDNFIFYFLTAFQYTLALSLIFKSQNEDNKPEIL